MTQSATKLLNDLRHSELSEFLREKFDDQLFLSRLLSTADEDDDTEQGAVESASTAEKVTSAMARIQQGIDSIDDELKNQVAENHAPLLRQSRQVRELERTMRVVGAGVSNLQVALHQIRSELYAPFETVADMALQLKRIHETAELLRGTIRFLGAARRLRAALDTAQDSDLPTAAIALMAVDKVAVSVVEGEESVSSSIGGKIRSVQVVAAELDWIDEARIRLRARAADLLARGLEDRAPALTSLAVQTFKELGELDDRALSATDELKRSLQERAGQVAAAAAAAGNGALDTLNTVEALLEACLSCGARISHLHGILLDNSGGDSSVADSAAPWRFVSGHFSERLHALPLAVQRELVRDYPQLRSLILGRVKSMAVGGQEALFLAAVGSFERSFLTRSWERIRDAAAAVTRDDDGALAFASVAAVELQAVNSVGGSSDGGGAGDGEDEDEGDVRLAEQVADSVARGVREALGRAERALTTSADAYQVADAPSAAQRANAALFQVLAQLLAAVASVAQAAQGKGGLSDEALVSLRRALDDVSALAHGICAPLFSRFSKSAEALLFRLHDPEQQKQQQQGQESNSSSGPGGGGGRGGSDGGEVSVPVLIIRRRLAHFSEKILSMFRSPLLQEHRERLASRLLRVFARQATLSLPMSRGRKLRLAADFGAFEGALAQLIELPRALGEPYLQFRATKQLLFRSLDDIEELYAVAGTGARGDFDLNALDLIHFMLAATKELRGVLREAIVEENGVAEYCAKIEKEGEREFFSRHLQSPLMDLDPSTDSGTRVKQMIVTISKQLKS